MQRPEQHQSADSVESTPFDAFLNRCDPWIADRLGVHPVTLDNGPGFRFSVWAPKAKQISVVGDFNAWEAGIDPLFPNDRTGIWQSIAPGARAGQRYQYRIIDCDGQVRFKSDPFARHFASLPDKASLIHSQPQHEWRDSRWISARAQQSWLKSPITIYELHIKSWGHPAVGEIDGPLYQTIADPLIAYLKRMAFTHVQFMPLMEHPYDGSWGYQVTGYFAPTSRFGTPEDLKVLIDRLHQHGIGVILDWVPAHFPNDAPGLARFDGTPLFEYACPKTGQHPDWGTSIFDYNKPAVLSFLISSALTWLRDFHFDGLRVDAVASMIYRDYSRPSGDWVPNVDGGRENLEAVHFLRTLNELVGQEFPGVLRIAEESTAWPGVTAPLDDGGLGFDLKWNLGWMHDTLSYCRQTEQGRRASAAQLSLPALYQASESYCLPFSHDEVVHGKGSMLGKMPGSSIKPQADHLRALYGWMWAWPGKKLLFMGSEFGHRAEWNETEKLDWEEIGNPAHRGIQELVRQLNRDYRNDPERGITDSQFSAFRWLINEDPQGTVFAFLRLATDTRSALICISNFSDIERKGIRIGIPFTCRWKIKLNTSAPPYGGRHTQSHSIHPSGKSIGPLPNSMTLDLPPHTTLHLEPVAWERRIST